MPKIAWSLLKGLIYSYLFLITLSGFNPLSATQQNGQTHSNISSVKLIVYRFNFVDDQIFEICKDYIFWVITYFTNTLHGLYFANKKEKNIKKS